MKIIERARRWGKSMEVAAALPAAPTMGGLARNSQKAGAAAALAGANVPTVIVSNHLPKSPLAGTVIYNTTDGNVYRYDGTQWHLAGGSFGQPLPQAAVAPPLDPLTRRQQADMMAPKSIIALDGLREAIRRGDLSEADWDRYGEALKPEIHVGAMQAPISMPPSPPDLLTGEERIKYLVKIFQNKPEFGQRKLITGDTMAITVTNAAGVQTVYTIDHLEHARITLLAEKGK